MIVYKRNKAGRRFSIWDIKLPSAKGKWGKLAIRYGLIAVAALILFFIFDDIVMPILTRHGSEFPLPVINGMTIGEAEPALLEAGLSLKVTSEEYHPDKPTGTILSQFPAGGTMVKKGRIVKTVISLGQKAVEVPDLRGFSVRQARLKLEAVGFELGDMEWTSTDSLPEKVVVFSYPKTSMMIPFGSKVDLMVNRGPYQRTVFVPRLIGLSLTEATNRLAEKNLKVGLVTQIINENYLPETVLGQSEDAGSELLPDEEVDLVVSSTD